MAAARIIEGPPTSMRWRRSSGEAPGSAASWDEGIQVGDHHVEGHCPGAFEVRLVGGVPRLGEKAEVYLPVEGLHEPALHLGLAGVVAHLDEVGAATEGCRQGVEAAPRRIEADARAGGDHAPDEIGQAGLVVGRGEDVLDRHEVGRLLNRVERHRSPLNEIVSE